ncbi:MAG: flavin reductase family protein [candidate division WS1 bacterium]|jgi:flavin reductase (DIM6/NTAB) family NADH-FMN oxidoreductase RutF|nr:flavin reductase family protein [candidate division WS1 bacterium]
MPKIEVPFDQFMREATAALRSNGALLASLDAEGRPNAMTIGWGVLGVIWGKPIYVALVRPSRYTYGCLESTGDFTVNIPYDSQAEEVLFCGTESGRDRDKFAECGFTPLPSAVVKSVGIGECGLVYECQVVHRNDLVPEALSEDIRAGAYAGGDFHRCYFGEILRTVADSDFLERF